ncbi:MAG: hypothetical protein RDV48_28270 [Candidatus Eremiobacteraeota bacterium]|nr:hypothetical protein [Candidatus Eremiobacteraeota bacterium]
MNARRFLTEHEREAVEKAVSEAEKLTSAEIICAIATESGRYERAITLMSILSALVALLAANFAGAALLTAPGSWSHAEGIPLTWQLAAVAGGFLAGAAAGIFWRSLRRPFIGRREMDEEVKRSSAFVYALAKMGSTRQRGGVLIYLSLFEKSVLILADQGAEAVLGKEGAEELSETAAGHLRGRKHCEAFTVTIAAVAQKLKEGLPPEGENPDELPNALLLYHPRP